MAAKTFTLINNGTVSYNITGITFNTPAGIAHSANLTNFTGGTSNFTGASYSGTTPMAVGQSKTFTVDHNYLSGASGIKTGSILISTDSGASASITTTILAGDVGLTITNPLPGQGTYNATAQNVISGLAQITLVVASDGRFTVTAEAGNDFSGYWVTPYPSSSGESYWVRFTRQSLTGDGNYFALPSTGWLQLTQDRSVIASAIGLTNGVASTVSALYLVQISTDSAGATIVTSGTYRLNANGELGGVVNPLPDINASGTDVSRVGIQFNRNGTRDTLSDAFTSLVPVSSTAWYLNGSSTIGDSYYIRATYINGGFPTNSSPLNAWLQLNQTRLWVLENTSGSSSSLYFEISTTASTSGIVTTGYGYLGLFVTADTTSSDGAPVYDQNAGGFDGGSGGSECFKQGTLITMVDNTVKKIEDVNVGDKVVSAYGNRINTVRYIEHSKSEGTKYKTFYAPKGQKPFATENHPIYVNGQWVSSNYKLSQKLYPWIDTEELDEFDIEPTNGQIVWNLWVDGDHTYQVNGFGTNSLVDDGGWLRVAVEQGIMTKEQITSVTHAISNSSSTVAYGALILSNLVGYLNVAWLTKYVADMMLGNKSRIPMDLAIVAVGSLAMLVRKIKKVFK